MSSSVLPLGALMSTRGVSDWTAGSDRRSMDVLMCLARHQSRDYGDLCEEDRAMNDEAVEQGYRVLSAYEVDGRKLWVITEADRSTTTVLFPEEY